MRRHPLHVRATVDGSIAVVQPTPPSTPASSDDDLTDHEWDDLKAIRDADNANRAALHTSLLSLAAGSVDRSRAGATAIVTAAGAIASVYAGLLGFVFSVGEEPLPLRALLSPIFLAISIALATAFLSYITAERSALAVDESGGWSSRLYKRAGFFIRYTRGIVARRVWMLQGAVIALAVGVACIALPFVSNAPATAEPVPTHIPTVAAWPTPPPPSGQAELDQILYQAQVDEAVAQAQAVAEVANAQEKDAATPTAPTSWLDGDGFWAVLGGGLVLVVLMPLVTWLFSRRAPD